VSDETPGWREATDDDVTEMLRGATEAQRSSLLSMLDYLGRGAVRIRCVAEFDGEVNQPIGLEVVGGGRFLIMADGERREYPREDGSA
jgi:hypothetical protein